MRELKRITPETGSSGEGNTGDLRKIHPESLDNGPIEFAPSDRFPIADEERVPIDIGHRRGKMYRMYEIIDIDAVAGPISGTNEACLPAQELVCQSACPV